MALKLGLIKGHVLDRHGPLSRLVFNHTIDQGKGVAMGKKPLNLLRGQHHWLGLKSGLNQGIQPGVELDTPARTAANEV